MQKFLVYEETCGRKFSTKLTESRDDKGYEKDDRGYKKYGNQTG